MRISRRRSTRSASVPEISAENRVGTVAASPSEASANATKPRWPEYSGAVAIDQTRVRTIAAGAA
jgi:hypothetical protein